MNAQTPVVLITGALTGIGQRSRTADACYGAGNQHNGGLGIHRGFLKPSCVTISLSTSSAS